MTFYGGDDEFEYLEEFKDEVKCLEVEHQLSSKNISRVKEVLARCRMKVDKSEVILEKLGSFVLTDRFQEYIQARGWHECTARMVDMEFDQGLRGLRNSLKNSQRSVDHMREIVARALRYDSEEVNVRRDLTAQLQGLVIASLAPALSSAREETDVNTEVIPRDDDEKNSVIPPEEIVDDRGDAVCILHMAMILNMFREDLLMKERIVGDLGLDTTADRMDVYSTVWAMRPCVDDEVLKRALTVLDPMAPSREKCDAENSNCNVESSSVRRDGAA